MPVTPINIVLYHWLEPFLIIIKEKGITVSPDTHIQLLKVLNGISGKIDSPAVLFDYISPILAKTNEQRRLLKEEFDEHFGQFNIPPVLPPDTLTPPAISKRILFLLGGILLIAIFGFIYWYKTRVLKNEAEAKYQIQNINAARPVIFSAGLGFEKPADTLYADYAWDFGDGSIDTSGKSTISHLYSRPGTYKTSLTLSENSGKLIITKPFAVQEITVCKPQIFLQSDDDAELILPAIVRFYPIYDSLFPPSGENTWLVNGHIKKQNSPEFSFRFDTAGLHTVSYIDNKYDSTNSCQNSQADKPVYIKPPTVISLNIIQSGDKATPPVKLNGLFLLIMALLVAAAIAAYLWTLAKIISQSKKDKQTPDDILDGFKGMKPPYEIPFKTKEDIIDDEPLINRLSRFLKRRMPDESSFINLPLTIKETIKADGLIIPYWSYKTRPVEYLVLIDRTDANNQQVRLFEYLLNRFSKSDLFIEKFYFSGQPSICTNEQYPSGIAVSRLFDMYPSHVCILFGDGYSFIKKSYPALNEDLVNLFKKWEYVAVFTPVPYNDWNYKEELLEQAFKILPADLEGQLLLFSKLEGWEDNYQEYLQKVNESYKLDIYDFNEAEDLEKYLGSDSFLFQWLCAVAVYSALHWEVLLGIGDALQKEAYPKESINYSSLLKLVRIPWMKEGSMPDDTRLELLKKLTPVNEQIARRALIDLMNEAAASLNEKSFVFEKLQMQRITDKFLLYAQDPDDPANKTYKEAFEQFKILWSNDRIPDYPLTAYLKKEEGGAWSTMLGNKNLSEKPDESKSIDDFFDDAKPLNQKRWQKWRRASFITSCLLLLFLVIVSAFKSQLHGTAFDKALSITERNKDFKVPFSFGYQPGECLSNIQAQTDSASFSLQFGTANPFVINGTDTLLNFDIPFSWTIDSTVRLTVGSKNIQYTVDTIISLTGDSIRLNYTGCPVYCNNWVEANNKNMPAGFINFWYNVDKMDGEADNYATVYIDSNRISDEEITNVYNCASDKQMFKIITRRFGADFKSYIVSGRSGSSVIGYYANEKTYPSLDKAVADTFNPVLTNLFSLSKNSWTGMAANVFADALKGSWKNTEKPEATFLNLDAGSLNYKGTTWSIHQTSMQTIAGKTFYSVKLARQDATAGNVDSILLYALPINDNKLLVSEQALHSPADKGISGSWYGKDGVFKTFTKTDTIFSGKTVPLPAGLSEIWKGRTSNRLLNINLAKNFLYYSTGDPNTYGTYKIENVTQTSSGAYKILSIVNGVYNVFFIRDINSRGFELSACLGIKNLSASQIRQMDESACSQFNTMTLYYPVVNVKDLNAIKAKLSSIDNEKELTNSPGWNKLSEAMSLQEQIFLPTYGQTLVASEQQKLDIKADSILAGSSYEATAYLNKSFTAVNINIAQLTRSGRRALQGFTFYNAVIPQANPFSRSYLVIKMKGAGQKLIQNTSSLSTELRKEYQTNYFNCEPAPAVIKTINNIIQTKILPGKSRYEYVMGQTGVPWYFIGILHFMESGSNFNINMQDGKPIDNDANRQQNQSYQNNWKQIKWEETAINLLNYIGIVKWSDWSIPGMLYRFEQANGFGYRKNDINTPYLWGGSNIYSKGQFITIGKFNANSISKLTGAAVIMKIMDQQKLLQDYKSAN